MTWQDVPLDVIQEARLDAFERYMASKAPHIPATYMYSDLAILLAPSESSAHTRPGSK